MAEISKKYLIKFPREVIDEAHRVFKGCLGERSELSSVEWHITHGDEELTLDSVDEFYYEYRVDVDSATLRYSYKASGKNLRIFTFSVNYKKGTTNVIISLDTQSDVKSVLKIFDDNYVIPETYAKIDVPKYEMETKIPSCHVDKNLLLRIEETLKNSIESDDSSKYEIQIIDSNGIESIPTMSEFKPNYFPNDIQKISIQLKSRIFGSTTITFSRKKKNSILKLSKEGDQARDSVMRSKGTILAILNEAKTKNYIFHFINDFFEIFFFGLSATTIVIVIISFVVSKTSISSPYLSLALGGIFFMILIYYLASRLNSYTTFETRQYESYKGWMNWFIFAFLEFILFTVVGGAVLRTLGIV